MKLWEFIFSIILVNAWKESKQLIFLGPCEWKDKMVDSFPIINYLLFKRVTLWLLITRDVGHRDTRAICLPEPQGDGKNAPHPGMV